MNIFGHYQKNFKVSASMDGSLICVGDTIEGAIREWNELLEAINSGKTVLRNFSKFNAAATELSDSIELSNKADGGILVVKKADLVSAIAAEIAIVKTTVIAYLLEAECAQKVTVFSSSQEDVIETLYKIDASSNLWDTEFVIIGQGAHFETVCDRLSGNSQNVDKIIVGKIQIALIPYAKAEATKSSSKTNQSITKS